MPKIGLIVAVLITVAGLAACGRMSGTATTAHVADPDDALFDHLSPSRDQLKAILKDPDSARFEDVSAYRFELKGNVRYIFCGKLNAKNGFGGYTGSEEFIASDNVAMVQDEYSDFETAWNTYCQHWVQDVVF